MSFLIGAEFRFKVQKDTQNSRIVLDSFNFREKEMSRLGIIYYICVQITSLSVHN